MIVLNVRPRTQGVRFYNPVFDRALSDFYRNAAPANGAAKNNPAVNVSETTEAFKIELAVPGFDKADFNVSTEKDVLTIAAKKEVNNDENGTLRRKEFNYNEFKRSFRLPEDVNIETIEAVYVNGILTVTLPKVVVAPTVKKVEIG
jgi:HSP20 family protein